MGMCRPDPSPSPWKMILVPRGRLRLCDYGPRRSFVHGRVTQQGSLGGIDVHGLIHANERSPATLLMMSTLTVENNLSDHVELFLLFYRYSGLRILFGNTVKWRKRGKLLSGATASWKKRKYKIKIQNKI